MSCEEIREDLELYALGLLDTEEHARVAGHLASGCPVCDAGLRRALTLNAAVAAETAAPAPAPALRARVIETLVPRRPTRAWTFLWAGLAAGLAIVALVLQTDRRERMRELADARVMIERAEQSSAQLARALALLSDPQTRLASAGPEARASYYLNPRQGVLLIASNLDPLAAGRTYQMWIIPRGRDPQPAGLFRPNERGAAVHLFETTFDPATTAALAITVEPEAGSPAPTTTPMLVASPGP